MKPLLPDPSKAITAREAHDIIAAYGAVTEEMCSKPATKEGRAIRIMKKREQ